MNIKFFKNPGDHKLVERPGSTGLWTSQGDYVGNVPDDLMRAEIVARWGDHEDVEELRREIEDLEGSERNANG